MKKSIALSGKFSDIETLFSAKSFLNSIGSNLYDSRFDNAQFIDGNRNSYLFNSSIQEIDNADAILLVGSNPRWEAAVLNSRIRKAYINNDCKIGLIGPLTNLTYNYTHLSSDISYLNKIYNDDCDFSKILKNAKKPLIIIGTSALNYEEGGDVLKICSKISCKYKISNKNFNGLNILQQNISRVGALDIGFYNNKFDNNFLDNVKEEAERNKPVVFLLGLDDMDLSIFQNSFVVYIGHHGDKGAHIADVILPAPAFPEKSSTFVNMEGRVMQTTKCYHPIGESKDEWKIFRALSNEINNDLKFNNIEELRLEIINDYEVFKELNTLPQIKNLDFKFEEKIKSRNLQFNINNFYMTDSISRASETMAKCTKEILNIGCLMFNQFIIPGLIIIAQIMAVVVPILISVAFLVYAERKVLALIQLRRGPNVVGPFGLFQSFADALKLITKENIIPSGSNKVVFILAPIITMVLSLAGWAVIPFAPGWVVSDINVGIMYLFAVSSLGVYGVIMAGWASNSQYPFLGALRSAAQMVSYEVSIGFVIITVLLCVGSLKFNKNS